MNRPTANEIWEIIAFHTTGNQGSMTLDFDKASKQIESRYNDYVGEMEKKYNQTTLDLGDRYYECKCGHEFDRSLGKYGCPNCNGMNAAKLKKRGASHGVGQKKEGRAFGKKQKA